MGKHSFEEILAAVPPRAPRSRLEPYRELIEELRGRGVTFREIAEILANRCNVRVTRAAVHDFLRRRTRQQRPASVKQPRALPSQVAPIPVEEADTQFEYDPSEPLALGGRRLKEQT